MPNPCRALVLGLILVTGCGNPFGDGRAGERAERAVARLLGAL